MTMVDYIIQTKLPVKTTKNSGEKKFFNLLIMKLIRELENTRSKMKECKNKDIER